ARRRGVEDGQRAARSGLDGLERLVLAGHGRVVEVERLGVAAMLAALRLPQRALARRHTARPRRLLDVEEALHQLLDLTVGRLHEAGPDLALEVDLLDR